MTVPLWFLIFMIAVGILGLALLVVGIDEMRHRNSH